MAVEAILIAWVVVSAFGIAVLLVSHAKLWIEFKSLQKSTHQVTYVNPIEENIRKLTDEERKSLQKDIFDNIN